MKCDWCGEVIEGKPVWRNNKAYCSDECSKNDSIEEEEEEEEEEEK